MNTKNTTVVLSGDAPVTFRRDSGTAEEELSALGREVQQFVTLRFGDLWLDVPIGPLVTAVSESWKSTAASPSEPKKEEEEVSSVPTDGFVPVISKSAKRRMRAAARASKAVEYDHHMSVHKTASSSSVPPGFAKAPCAKPANQQPPLKISGTSLQEWPILAKRAAPLKIDSPTQSATSTKVAVPLTPSKLKVGTSANNVVHEASGASSYKHAPKASGAAHKPSAAEKGKAVMVEEAEIPRPRGQLRVDAPEFIPTYTEPDTKRSLMWRGVYLTPEDIRTGHVDPTAAISDPLSSVGAMPRPSCEASFDPARHRRRRQRAHQAWVDLPAAIDSNTATHMLPGHSMSADDIGGAIMRRADALAKWPEYDEFVKEVPKRREYVTQAGRASARRAALKRREMALRADSGHSRVEGKSSPSSSQVSKGKVSKKSEDTPRKGATMLTPWPARKRISSNSFEVFNSLPIGVIEPTDSNSETSSTSVHFKRKKARKNIVPGHRPITRSQMNSSNDENESNHAESHKPLCDNSVHNSENELKSHEEQPDGNTASVEQVLTANASRSVEEQIAQLTAALQQKEDELVELRSRTENNTNAEVERNASSSHGNDQGGTGINLEAIQKMIAEGVKAQNMQTHYSMRPGYVKPYPPDVDLVPFPANYRQPQFSKFSGGGSPHEHIAHFLAACQDTAQNGALLLRQFVQTLSGPAFTWYSKLPPSSVKTWEQMQDAFLERFYSTQRTVGITELTQTEQGMNEKAADFINRWRNLSLHCPQPITETEAVRMCMNNLRPDMAVYLQGVRPVTFEELASKATYIENYNQLIARRTKAVFKPVEKSLQRDKIPAKTKPAQVMETTTMKPQFQSGAPSARNMERTGVPAHRRPTLSERQNREYSFPVDEIGDLFVGLLQLKLIELPNSKRPEEANRTNDPNFCHYHRILGHTLKDCFVVKNIIQKMIDEGTIDTDLLKSLKKGKKVAAANVATLQDDSVSCSSSNLKATHNDTILIQECGFPPMIIPGRAKMQGQHKGEAHIPCNYGVWPSFSASRGSQVWGQRRSKRRVPPPVKEEAPPLRFAPEIYQHTTKRMKVPSEEFNVLTIGVFEDDDESLCFPEEEPLEVHQVHLRSGRQLADPHPPPRKEPKNKDVVPNDSTDPACRVPVKYDVIAHLKKIPAMLSVYDALCLSSDMRKALITALTFPENYRVEVSQTEVEESDVLNITFTDEDRLLGSKKHNRPLLMFGEIDESPTNRIMIDGATSYNALLGRPWLHENQVVPSTLHQCIKYREQSGETVRIFADKRPFTVAESFYADAKFYFEHVEKVYKPKAITVPESNMPEEDAAESSANQKVYQYIPSSQRKSGDPIFRIVNKSKWDMISSQAHLYATAGGNLRHLKRRCLKNRWKLYMKIKS
ncbi:hypothetical protein QYE76_045686 [Lolium multiflorum]|uniref:Retrotransposon gag domain-containing protein n=1 Tax=Lolium multiflorum TaxID=4521 RepID=A0AAD8TN26_LOLMU|nr:hypothetical protein QYE76_045686 [Lolium multiflorum]